MPIYAYRCEGCGFQKDALQKMSDPPLVDCPSCGQPKLAKQVTAAGFALKGTGWYVTDFRDQGKKSSTSTDASTPAAAPSAATPPASAGAATSEASSSPSTSSSSTATAGSTTSSSASAAG